MDRYIREMDEGEIIKNELSFFSDCPRVFTLEEVANRIDIPINPESIRNHLSSNKRFLCIRENLRSKNLFISKRAVLWWYIYLNIHLGKLRHARISKHEFLFLTRSLSVSNYWDRPPKEIVDYGERFGFIGRSESFHEYVFPLAYLLSFTPTYPCIAIAQIIRGSLEKLNIEGLDKQTLNYEISQSNQFETYVFLSRVEELITRTVDWGISQLRPRDAYVLLCRTGWLTSITSTLQLLQNELPYRWLTPPLSTGDRLTLQQIADKVGGTRERIRQIEKRACCQEVLIRPFLKALIYDVLSRGGRLIYEIDSQCPVRVLIAKCLGIPCVKIPDSRLFIMGLSLKDFGEVSYPKYAHNTCSAIEWIESKIGLVLVKNDLEKLSEVIDSRRPKHLPVREKLRAVLESIGHPAHYSEIAEVYNELFPEDARTEAHVNSVLHGRRCKDNGIVWIGARGMFALKDWGYKRPRHSLQKTVVNIAQKLYRDTHKPVRFEVIVAELGKHRKFVKHSSLQTAIKSNPGLERVSRELFVPKKSKRIYTKRISGDSLDKILQRFENQYRLHKYHK